MAPPPLAEMFAPTRTVDPYIDKGAECGDVVSRHLTEPWPGSSFRAFPLPTEVRVCRRGEDQSGLLRATQDVGEVGARKRLSESVRLDLRRADD